MPREAHTLDSDSDRLRCMVDQHGLATVVELLSKVCDDKVEELEYGEDSGIPSTKSWRVAGERLESLAVKLERVFGD